MANNRKRQKGQKAFLPATPCTPEFRKRVIRYADEYGMSIAAVQRTALDIFLSEFESKLSEYDSQNIEKEKAS